MVNVTTKMTKSEIEIVRTIGMTSSNLLLMIQPELLHTSPFEKLLPSLVEKSYQSKGWYSSELLMLMYRIHKGGFNSSALINSHSKQIASLLLHPQEVNQDLIISIVNSCKEKTDKYHLLDFIIPLFVVFKTSNNPDIQNRAGDLITFITSISSWDFKFKKIKDDHIKEMDLLEPQLKDKSWRSIGLSFFLGGIWGWLRSEFVDKIKIGNPNILSSGLVAVGTSQIMNYIQAMRVKAIENKPSDVQLIGTMLGLGSITWIFGLFAPHTVALYSCFNWISQNKTKSLVANLENRLKEPRPKATNVDKPTQ